MTNTGQIWISPLQETVASYRRMIDRAVEQLTDTELNTRPIDGINSVAVILRHLGGNLISRWTDFLTTDGEKPDRNRDGEFEDWMGDRTSLLAYFDAGWSRLLEAISQIADTDLSTSITIRGEQHTLPQALVRSIAHIAYHAGQILLVARAVHQGEWQWLTIAPGDSQRHNQRTWGSAASRGVTAISASEPSTMHIPPGFNQLFPYFFVRDAGLFVEFLVQGFGGTEASRHLRPDGRIANAQVQIGTSTVMISEASDDFPPMPGSYYLYVADADTAMQNAVKAGATPIMPVQEMPYGERQGGIRDRHNNVWWLSQRLQAGPY